MRRTGTAPAKRTFARTEMDDKTINLWRQIEGARRVGKRQAIGRSAGADPPRPQRLGS